MISREILQSMHVGAIIKQQFQHFRVTCMHVYIFTNEFLHLTLNEEVNASISCGCICANERFSLRREMRVNTCVYLYFMHNMILLKNSTTLFKERCAHVCHYVYLCLFQSTLLVFVLLTTSQRRLLNTQIIFCSTGHWATRIWSIWTMSARKVGYAWCQHP